MRPRRGWLSALLAVLTVGLASCSSDASTDPTGAEPTTVSATTSASTLAPTDQGTQAPPTTEAPHQSTTPEPTDAPVTTAPQTTTVLDTGPHLSCWTSDPDGGSGFGFLDATDARGLVEPLTGMHGHAAAWGDVDGDHRPDLVVGTFANRPIENYAVRGATGPRPDTLLLSAPPFQVDSSFPPTLGRTSGAVIVDLDNDGDHDVVLARNMRNRARASAPTQIYRNDGSSFTQLDLDFGRLFSGRSVGVLDHDRNGLLDLLVLEDRFAGASSSVLLENRGDMQFVDVTSETGIPLGVHGLGIATSDVNGDGFTDFFVGGSNRLFVGGPTGFREADSSTFAWEVYGNEDDVAGAAIADLNRDGRPDLVVGHHFNSTLSKGQLVPVRIYMNRGADADGIPRFEDVTSAAGMVGLPTKAPHVDIVDFDNDGWPDILTSASADGGTRPAVFMHTGLDAEGDPRFEAPTGLGSPQYWVSGPVADVDRDGRIDIFLVEWEPTLPSLLMINDFESGNWLEVSVGPESTSGAIGAIVRVWQAGFMLDPAGLIGMREIVASAGYASGADAVAHFGLGDTDLVDVQVTYPDGATFEIAASPVNQHLRLPNGCG